MNTRPDAIEASEPTFAARVKQGLGEWKWRLVALATAALGSTLITCGRLHSLHSSDSLIPVLVSLQQWTFFYWDQDRFGMLIPLLALPFRDPFSNMLVQGWLGTTAALLAPLLAARLLLGPSGPWVTAGVLTNILVVGLVPIETQFDWFITQPYAISLCLGFAALLFSTVPVVGGNATATFFMVLAHWVNFGAFVLLLPCIVAEPREALRRFTLIAIGAAAGLLGALFLGSSESADVILTPVAHWATGWITLVRNTHGLFWHRGWLAAVLIGTGGVVALNRYQLLRQSGGAAAAVAISAALFYWMVIGSTEWVRLNAYSPRYIYPSLLMLAVGFAILVVSDARRDRVSGALTAVVVLLSLTVLVHQPASTNELKRTLNQRLGGMTTDILSSGATVVSGEYWAVWPAVFHANMARYRLTGRSDVFGLTARSRHTVHAWRRRTILMAVPLGDSEGVRNAEQRRLRLRLIERRSTLSLFIAEPVGTPDR